MNDLRKWLKIVEGDVIPFPRKKKTPLSLVQKALGHPQGPNAQESSLYRHNIRVERTVDGYTVFCGDGPRGTYDDPMIAHEEAESLEKDLDAEAAEIYRRDDDE